MFRSLQRVDSVRPDRKVSLSREEVLRIVVAESESSEDRRLVEDLIEIDEQRRRVSLCSRDEKKGEENEDEQRDGTPKTASSSSQTRRSQLERSYPSSSCSLIRKTKSELVDDLLVPEELRSRRRGRSTAREGCSE